MFRSSHDVAIWSQFGADGSITSMVTHQPVGENNYRECLIIFLIQISIGNDWEVIIRWIIFLKPNLKEEFKIGNVQHFTSKI